MAPDRPAADPPGRDRLAADRLSSDRFTRREFLATAGSAAAAVGLAGCGNRTVPHGWLDVGAPVDGALRDVAVTTAGPHAVGEGGAVVSRRGDAWRTVLGNGPAGQGNGLHGVAVTDDGRRVWLAGESGAAGAYDPVSDTLTDVSGPAGHTSTWTDVAVAGRAGSERVALLDGSGEVLPGRARQGTVRWGELTKPTGGEPGTAVDAVGRTTVVTDAAGGVYGHTGPVAPAERDEPGWTTMGLRGVETALRDVVAMEPDLITAVTDDGAAFDYDGYGWFRTPVADGALHAVDRRADDALTAGVDGAVYELADHSWQEADTPTGATFHGCALGTDAYADVAVGANGTVIERFG
ncbi:twin-arginine translocation signal domain-containing protein [Halosimplex halobium]|uniref:twin-arginine translocation signal domain-containing protein n=1 Tax=Halosimplex halobium TaxID=3396618 RepID=UPI003F548140